MKTISILIISLFLALSGTSQTSTGDSLIRGKVTVMKDDRIEMLGREMAKYNEGLANKIHMVKGYRLTIMSTTDRNQALNIRAKLLQLYPEHNVYMTFQSPYIRLKFGNFIERDEAEDMRKDIAASKLVSGNIYIVPEMVESKPDKTKLATQEP